MVMPKDNLQFTVIKVLLALLVIWLLKFLEKFKLKKLLKSLTFFPLDAFCITFLQEKKLLQAMKKMKKIYLKGQNFYNEKLMHNIQSFLYYLNI